MFVTEQVQKVKKSKKNDEDSGNISAIKNEPINDE